MRTKLLITIIIFVFCQFVGIAGTKKTPMSKYEIIVKTSEGTIRTWVLVKKIRIKPKLDRFYYGYYLNELFYKQGELQGKPVNGEFRRYDLKDNIIESGNCEYGLKIGLWKKLASGGAITETSEYHKGLMHGHRMIYKNGMPDIREKYRNGKMKRKPKYLNPIKTPKKGKDKKVMDKTATKKNLFHRIFKKKVPKTLVPPEIKSEEINKNGNPDIRKKHGWSILKRKSKHQNQLKEPEKEIVKNVKKKNLFQRLIKRKDTKAIIEPVPKNQKEENASKTPIH
jgi:hypothetical protein